MDSEKFITATFHFYSVTLSPATDERVGNAGDLVIYLLQVSNSGGVMDSFTVTVASSNEWSVVAPSSVEALPPGGVEGILLGVQIPTNAVSGTEDVVTVTVTSRGDPRKSARALLTTTVISGCVPVSQLDFFLVPQEPVVGEKVVFSSVGQGSRPISYTWDFGDETIVSTTNATVTHIYVTSGTYTVFLTATNACAVAPQVVSKTVSVVTPTSEKYEVFLPMVMRVESDAMQKVSLAGLSDNVILTTHRR